MIKIVAYDLAV